MSESLLTFNKHADLAWGYVGNMRMFEATGVKSCLVTDDKIDVNEYFIPNKEVIVLDEATNSIDKHNEEIIMDYLSKIDGLTLILISHNDQLLKKCDQIFLINEGKLQKIS